MNRWIKSKSAIVGGCLCFVVTSFTAQEPPEISFKEAGFSHERLKRIDTVMQDAVSQGRLAGLVTLVARHGRVVHFKAYGSQDRENKIPMQKDTIFRIASLTKTATSIGVMMLMEEGELLVNDPISKYIPSFKKTTVAVPVSSTDESGGSFTVVPANREITVRDLLTKTAGMGYPPSYLRSTYAPLDLHSFYFSDKAQPMSSIIDQIARLPFTSQPGEKYENGFATDVLGVLIENVSGMSLDDFFRIKIFTPLQMHDTYFYLPKDKASRFAAVYTAQPDGTVKRSDGLFGQGQGHYIDGPRMAFSAGGGLLSTANDYARLVQVLVNNGEFDGVRLLSPKTVQLMLTNHVGDMYTHPGSVPRRIANPSFGKLGFGYGAEITLDLGTANHLGSRGDFGYRSAYFSRYWGDPVEKLLALFFTQLSNYGGTSDLHYKYRSLVYQALISPSNY